MTDSSLLQETIECDGSADCGATTHVHGCFADEGNCDEPLEHGTGDLDADLDALGFDPFGTWTS